MRRRIVLLLAPLLVLLVLGVAIPFGVLVSERATQAAYVDRMGDATRFATMVDAATVSQDGRLGAELTAYAQLYDSPVWVLGLGGGLVHDPGVDLPDDPGLAAVVQRAFAGDRDPEAGIVWPWTSGALHVVEPVGRDSQVTAVVVIEAPTAHLRSATLRTWGVGAGLLLVPVVAMVVGLWPVTRWMLRPVHDLESVAVTVRSGDLDARADREHGPPELRELTSAFNAMVDTVQRTLRRQREFVADAAHQLRNPLASLQLSVENLEPYLRGSDAREAFEDAVGEASRLSDTFEAMLSSTEVLGTAPISDDDAWPIAQVLAVGEPRWRAVLEQAGMTLAVEARDPQVVGRQPAGGLVAVVDELVANAARLSEGTRVLVRSAVVAGGPDDGSRAWVRLTVEDDGVGLGEDERDAATGRFWRASRHQNVPGTGLGLAIVGDLLADVGGRFELEQAEPHGLRVVLLLPVVRGATHPRPELSE